MALKGRSLIPQSIELLPFKPISKYSSFTHTNLKTLKEKGKGKKFLVNAKAIVLKIKMNNLEKKSYLTEKYHKTIAVGEISGPSLVQDNQLHLKHS